MSPDEVPSSLIEFQDRFRTDRACESYLFRWRWPEGFRCPRCGCGAAGRLSTRAVYQCRGCRRQTSVTAGTVLHRSKVPLRKWFWAFFLVARHKKSISALQLQRDLGLGSYQTAWLMLHKIRSCFYEKPEWPLRGIIEIDESSIGGQGKGDRESEAPGCDAIRRDRAVGGPRVVGAVELGEKTKGRFHRWGGLRLRLVDDLTKDPLVGFVRENVASGSLLVTDGACRGLEDHFCEGEKGVVSKATKTQLRIQNPLPHVRLLFSNLETWLRGRFHGVSPKYLPAYLNEFVYRTSRRFDPTRLFAWVVRRVTHNPPLPLWRLRDALPAA